MLFIMKKLTSVMSKTLNSDLKTSEILSLLVKSNLKFLLFAELCWNNFHITYKKLYYEQVKTWYWNVISFEKACNKILVELCA